MDIKISDKIRKSDREDPMRQLSFSIEGREVVKRIGDVMASIRTKLEMKGFRKGKVPLATIDKHYGESVKANVIDDLVRAGLFEAVKTELVPSRMPLNVTDVTLSEDFDFAVVVEFPNWDNCFVCWSCRQTYETEAEFRDHLKGRMVVDVDGSVEAEKDRMGGKPEPYTADEFLTTPGGILVKRKDLVGVHE